MTWVGGIAVTILAVIVGRCVGMFIAVVNMDRADWPYVFVYLLPILALVACILLLPWPIGGEA